MSKTLLTPLTALFAVILTVGTQAQNPKKFFVKFADKISTPFDVGTPEDFLSQKAIDRRVAQGIPVIEQDLPVDPNYVAQVAALAQQVNFRSKWFNGVSVLLIDSADIAQINALPFVISSQPINILSGPVRDISKFGTTAPHPQGRMAASSVMLDYGLGTNQIEMIGGVGMHDQGYLGQGMTIAVLDAGFSNTDQLAVFDSLHNDGRIIATRDFVDGDENVYSGSNHGTQVLSTMASFWPQVLIGTAPKADYILCRTEASGSELIIEEYNWIAGAEFADSAGADVINSSLGYTDFDDPTMDHTYADLDGNTTPITQGADIAASKGILVVNSAGNSGSGSWFYLGAPADGDSVMAVGAVDSNGDYVEFSSKGPSADGDVKPNVAAQGSQAVIVNVNLQASESTQTANGTSFSSPIIAGMSACLWQANPTLTNMELMEVIQESASQYNNPDSLMGYGIPNFTMANLIVGNEEILPESTDKDELITVYPSPFHDELNGAFYSSRRQDVTIRLMDPLGREIRRIEEPSAKGCMHRFKFGVVGPGSGVYTIQVLSGVSSRFAKVVRY